MKTSVYLSMIHSPPPSLRNKTILNLMISDIHVFIPLKKSFITSYLPISNILFCMFFLYIQSVNLCSMAVRPSKSSLGPQALEKESPSDPSLSVLLSMRQGVQGNMHTWGLWASSRSHSGYWGPQNFQPNRNAPASSACAELFPRSSLLRVGRLPRRVPPGQCDQEPAVGEGWGRK